MPWILVTRGLPGSGKSTWAEEWVNDDPNHRVRVNRDDIRLMLGCHPIGTPEQEANVTVIEVAAVASSIAAGNDVIVDATNLRADRAKRWFELSDDVQFVDFPVPPEECGERDAMRRRLGGNSVGRDVIFSMAKQYHIKADGRLPKPPQRKAKERFTFKPYLPTGNLPEAYVFDIDGTLADRNDRDPYDQTRYGEDLVHQHVYRLLKVLSRDHSILVVTGRPDSAQAVTYDWLERHDIFTRIDGLYMRRAGDERNDAIVKAEILHERIAPEFDVIGAFDDRNRVVDAWRAMGIPCYQVAPGDF